LHGIRISLPDGLTANLYLGVAVTCLYTLVAMGLIIAFTWTGPGAPLGQKGQKPEVAGNGSRATGEAEQRDGQRL